MFGFMNMEGTYESRKVARYEADGMFVSTCRVTDSKNPYETAISHPSYNKGDIIIVEEYTDAETARTRHDHWVNVFTSKDLPEEVVDVAMNETSAFVKSIIGEQRYKKA